MFYQNSDQKGHWICFNFPGAKRDVAAFHIYYIN